MANVLDQLDAIDDALKVTAHAIAQEDQAAALAGLFGAVTGINALAAPNLVALSASLEHQVAGPPGTPPMARGILGRDRADVEPAELQKRLGKVLASVQEIVDKFGPDSFTVSAGFPLGVNVSLTWNSTKKAEAAS